MSAKRASSARHDSLPEGLDQTGLATRDRLDNRRRRYQFFTPPNLNGGRHAGTKANLEISDER